MPFSLRLRLSGMMFLQYFVLGIWLVTFPTFLMAAPHEGGLYLTGKQVGLLYSTMAIAAMAAPFLAGLLADRLFPAQWVLAVLHLAGACSLYAIWSYSNAQNELALQVMIKQGKSFVISPPAFGSTMWIGDYTLENEIRRQADFRRYESRRVANRIRIELENRGLGGIANLLFGVPTNEQRLKELLDDMYYSIPILEDDRRRVINDSIAQILDQEPIRAICDSAFSRLFGLMLLNALFYLPTVTLANAIAFRKLPDPARQYGSVRVFGTFGWIAALIGVGMMLPKVSPMPLLVSSMFTVVLALFCLTLPYTAPNRHPRTLGDTLGLPAIKMLAEPSFRVFVVCSTITTLLSSFHNIYLHRYLVDRGIENAAAWQTLGQSLEVVSILLIPFALKRIGIKWMLLIGLIASVIRFGFYAWGGIGPLLAIGIPMHGLCFGFFFVAAALYVNQQAPHDLRASAQGLVAVFTLGLGTFAGNFLAGWMVDVNCLSCVVNWPAVWAVPAFGSLALVAWFAVAFREPEAVNVTTP